MEGEVQMQQTKQRKQSATANPDKTLSAQTEKLETTKPIKLSDNPSTKKVLQKKSMHSNIPIIPIPKKLQK